MIDAYQPSDHERYCLKMLDDLRKSYELAAKPYRDELAKLHMIRIPRYYVEMPGETLVSFKDD
jgi:hypothetical protein